MERKFRVISGVAYPHLVREKRQSRVIKANLSNPHDYYYDDSVRISEDEMSAFVGKPICVEHNRDIEIGQVTHVFADKDGKMRMTGRIYVDNDLGQDAFERIEAGSLTGMSVGYDIGMRSNDNGSVEVDYKNAREITVCLQPFFEGAHVSVTASKQEKKTISFQIMASEQQQLPPPVKPNEEASTLAAETDKMAQRLRDLETQNKAFADRAALLEAAEKKRLDEYASKQRQEYDEIMRINEQQYKDQNGETATLPAEYKEASAAAALHPDGAGAWQSIVASARTWQKERDSKQQLEKTVAEMADKLKRLEQDHQSAMQSVTASQLKQLSSDTDGRRAATATDQSATTTTTTVAASSKGLNMSNLFVKAAAPSAAERELYNMNYGHTGNGNLSVNASATTTLAAPPTHPFVEQLQFSMRKRSPQMFAHLVNNDFTGANPYQVTSTVYRDGDLVSTNTVGTPINK